jgi:hypothetical protein
LAPGCHSVPGYPPLPFTTLLVTLRFNGEAILVWILVPEGVVRKVPTRRVKSAGRAEASRAQIFLMVLWNETREGPAKGEILMAG